MSHYRITIALQRGIYGATETYVSGDITYSTLGPQVTRLLEKRAAILGSGTNFIGVRISELGTGGLGTVGLRRSNLYPPGTYTFANAGIDMTVPPAGTFTTGGTGGLTDQARACAQIRIVYDVNRFTTRYLAFVPDALLGGGDEQLYMADVPAWSTQANMWIAEISGGRWNIWAQTSTTVHPHIPIQTWVKSEASPGLLGIVVAASPAPGISAGRFVKVYGVRRRGTDSLSYNGRYFVESINSTMMPGSLVIYLRGTEAGDADSVKLPGTVRQYAHAAYPIQFYTPLRAGIHKRGKPLTSPHGRRSTRVSLDP